MNKNILMARLRKQVTRAVYETYILPLLNLTEDEAQLRVKAEKKNSLNKLSHRLMNDINFEKLSDGTEFVTKSRLLEKIISINEELKN